MATKKITLNELRSIVKQIIKEDSNQSIVDRFKSQLLDAVEVDHCVIKKFDKKNNLIYGHIDIGFLDDEGVGFGKLDELPFVAKLINDSYHTQTPGSAPDEWVSVGVTDFKVIIGDDPNNKNNELYHLLKNSGVDMKPPYGQKSLFQSFIDEIKNTITYYIRIKTNNKRFKLNDYKILG